MNKLLLALSILTAGGVVCARLGVQTTREFASSARSNEEYAYFTNRLSDLAESETALKTEIREKKTLIHNAPPPVTDNVGLLESLSNSKRGAGHGGISPKSRKSLGISWDNSPDYVLVSKAALKKMWFIGISPSGEVSPTLCDVLALTAQERTAIEAACQRADATYAAWFKTAVAPVAPSGEIVAEYRAPANPDLARKIQQQEISTLAALLGPERLDLLPGFGNAWMEAHGSLGEETVRFTVHYAANRQPPLWFQMDHGGSSSCADVQPDSFPALFRGIFPGGWRDVAQRGGFQLPEEFKIPAPGEP